jgi:hypothetical protein
MCSRGYVARSTRQPTASSNRYTKSSSPTPERRRSSTRRPTGFDGILFMRELRLDDRELAFFCTLTTFGTPRDVTLAELTIVAFYPANRETAKALTAAVSEAEPD